MKYCKSCGTQMDSAKTICPNCGAVQNQGNVADTGGFGWGLLGFCIPLVGLILFLVWKDERPNSAKAAGVGALISVGISLLAYLLMFVLAIGASAGM